MLSAGLVEEAWAGPALRRSRGTKEISNRQNLEDAFARTLDAIEHDAAFPQVEIVQRITQPTRESVAFIVTIDRPGGVDLALCERIAARLNASLGPIEVPYALQVESAGLERPLMKPHDYQRFAGKRARVVTTLSIEINENGRAPTHGRYGN